MKIVRMTGGLANRMLQYSYALYLKEKGYNVLVDYYEEFNYEHEKVGWEAIFPSAPLNQAPKRLILKYGGTSSYLDKIRRKYLSFTTKVWNSINAVEIPKDSDIKKSCYFIGTYQDVSVLECIKKTLLHAYTFESFKTGTKNYLLEQKMKSENSVAIHVRKRDDYVKQVSYMNTCPLEYYTEAIKIIKERVENPVFYVFTDNPEWVKKNFEGIDYTLVEGNPVVGFGNHFDMQLMSCCKHNIIANSTYSWWGAFLNPYPDKIVIDPKYWYNPEIPNLRNRLNKTACEGWILL